MKFRALTSYAGIMSLALLISACGGGGGGGQPQQPQPQNQTIAFATAGPVNSRVGTTVTNVASGGAGTGAVTYASSNTAVATVNSTTGVATLAGQGSSTITATKAASTGFNAASATYTLNATVDAQTITFAQAGPLTGPAGTAINNAASGGAGTGTITYGAADSNVATIDAAGVATLVGVGTTTVTAAKAPSLGFAAAVATYQLTVTQGTQTIAFAVPGTRNVLLSSTNPNAASGGAGTGAITYASGNTTAISVNAATGVATAVGLGTATVTATKAADANYAAAQATYIANVQSAGTVHAWVGAQSSEVFLPATANGKEFARVEVSDCTLVADDLANCVNVESSPVNGAAILDDKGTLTTPAYYAIDNGTDIGEPVLANAKRFSQRVLHGAVFFKNRYWIIAGAVPTLPGAVPTVHVPQSDVWSSSDGKTWLLETANAAFGTRWLHQTIVYQDAIWVLGGLRINNSGANDVWRSPDGVNWTQITAAAPFTAFTPTPPAPVTIPSAAATVFNGKMWVVRGGASLSSTDGITWTQESATGAIDGVFSREYASLTVYNNKMWYIGGSKVLSIANRIAQNDIWSSPDGITWTLVTPVNPFAARQQHSAFVLGNRLWVFGGQRWNGTTAGPPPKDAWSTTDGTIWREEAENTEIDFSWLMGTVQQPGRVTLMGGVLRSHSNQVWTTTDGDNWTELAPYEFAPNLLSRGVVFKGAMWLIGGGRIEGLDTNEVWRSSDGLTWSRVTTAGNIFAGLDSHRVVVFNERLWVIGGWDFFTADGGSETFNNEVWSSADGVSWIKHTPSGAIFSARAGHDATVFNGRMWVTGGTDGVDRFNDVWSSADGVNWVLEKDHAAFTPRYGHSVVALGNALWLIAGTDTPAGGTAFGLQDAWRSLDGRTWTPLAALPFGARLEQAATVFNGRIYLTTGMSSTDYFTNTKYRDVWSTVDGNNWRPETPAAQFSGRNAAILLNYDDRLYLIGGFGISRTHDVWRSDDGVDWSTAFSHPISAP